MTSRRAELIVALDKLGMTLRADSKLCQSFVEGKLDETQYPADRVAEIMAKHKFLYEYTDYPVLCNYYFPKLAATMSQCLGSYTAAFNYVVSCESESMKAWAIECAGGYPLQWPWLECYCCDDADTETTHACSSPRSSVSDLLF